MKASLKLGLFSYPVLQAADILLYRYDDPRRKSPAAILTTPPGQLMSPLVMTNVNIWSSRGSA